MKTKQLRLAIKNVDKQLLFYQKQVMIHQYHLTKFFGDKTWLPLLLLIPFFITGFSLSKRKYAGLMIKKLYQFTALSLISSISNKIEIALKTKY
ncbi:MAG: hypothetical protein ACOVQX_00655 [Legionella sp.]